MDIILYHVIRDIFAVLLILVVTAKTLLLWQKILLDCLLPMARRYEIQGHKNTMERLHIRKHIVIFRFKADNLLYDIKNIAFMTGDQLPEQPDEKVRSNIQDVAEEGNVDFLRRKLELAYHEVKERLYTYLERMTFPVEIEDDDIRERHEYVMALRVPVEASESTLELVKNLIHEYLVNFTLAEWFAIVKKDEAQVYYGRCDTYIDRIKECMTHRIRHRQRPLFPPY